MLCVCVWPHDSADGVHGHTRQEYNRPHVVRNEERWRLTYATPRRPIRIGAERTPTPLAESAALEMRRTDPPISEGALGNDAMGVKV